MSRSLGLLVLAGLLGTGCSSGEQAPFVEWLPADRHVVVAHRGHERCNGWRVDAWAEAAINNVRFGSFWNAPASIDHHVDDVVVATAPIGCPDP